jgi:hypothetical protein
MVERAESIGIKGFEQIIEVVANHFWAKERE